MTDTLRDQVAAALEAIKNSDERTGLVVIDVGRATDAILAAVPALSVPGGLAEAAGAYLIAIDKWRGRQEAVLAESDAMVWRRAVADAEKALRAALSGDVAKYGWHGNGDLCLGPECGVVDEYGDHPMADVHSNDWYVGYAAGQRDRAALAQRAPERSEPEACHIEPAFSQHEYAVDYCETHDRPASECTALAQQTTERSEPLNVERLVNEEAERLIREYESLFGLNDNYTKPIVALRNRIIARLAATDAAEQGR